MTYTLQMLDDTTLAVKDTSQKSHVQVRGAPDYTTHGYDSSDPLHSFLDRLDPGTCSAVLTYVSVTLSPANKRAGPSFDACKELMKTNP